MRGRLARLLRRNPPGTASADSWRYHTENVDDHVHVWPIGDVIPHLTEGIDANEGFCPCDPITKPVIRQDGSCGWLIVHNALDGREE